MTDNRTTELLRKLLDERGVKYSDFTSATRNGKAIFKTRWKHERGYAELSEWESTGSNNLFIQNVDPEQAIAATLGRLKAKSHPYGYERDTGAYDCTRCECGCINDISATYCNDCGGKIEIDESAEKEYYDGYSKHNVFAKKHDDGSLEFCERRYVPEDAATLGNGTLTAEQVREAIERNFGKVAVLDDGEPVEWRDDWVCKVGINYKAIADELNARAERTCECVEEYAESPLDGKTIVLHRCSECHELMRPHMRYCQNCGCKVVDA